MEIMFLKLILGIIFLAFIIMMFSPSKILIIIKKKDGTEKWHRVSVFNGDRIKIDLKE